VAGKASGAGTAVEPESRTDEADWDGVAESSLNQPNLTQQKASTQTNNKVRTSDTTTRATLRRGLGAGAEPGLGVGLTLSRFIGAKPQSLSTAI
jgi:hypothetical protein